MLTFDQECIPVRNPPWMGRSACVCVSVAVLGSDPVGVQLLGVIFTPSHFLFCMVSARTTILAS